MKKVNGAYTPSPSSLPPMPPIKPACKRKITLLERQDGDWSVYWGGDGLMFENLTFEQVLYRLDKLKGLL